MGEATKRSGCSTSAVGIHFRGNFILPTPTGGKAIGAFKLKAIDLWAWVANRIRLAEKEGVLI